jgi:stress response protein YsnF
MTLPAETMTVVTANGLKGTAEPGPAPDGARTGLVRVTLEGGRELWVGPELMIRQPGGHYLLPVAVPANTPERRETIVVPVVEEEVSVEKRAVPSGGVRVSKVVHERDEMVDTTTVAEEVNVQREAAGHFVDQAEPARVEGDRTIIPIYEEVVVVEKRLRLKERWIVSKRRIERPGAQAMTLRREEAVVERLEASPPAGEPPA